MCVCKFDSFVVMLGWFAVPLAWFLVAWCAGTQSGNAAEESGSNFVGHGMHVANIEPRGKKVKNMVTIIRCFDSRQNGHISPRDGVPQMHEMGRNDVFRKA